MAPLLFMCPTTKRRSPTRIETDAKSLATAWRKTLKIQCPHCRKVHQVSVRDAYIAFAVQDRTDPIVVDRSPDMVPAAPKGFIPRKAPDRMKTNRRPPRGPTTAQTP
jgi:hypothetical protein